MLAGTLTGRISGHLRHQSLPEASTSTTGPNVFNPLEAYEIDFSGSSISFKIKEWSSTLGHRRVIMPTESAVIVKIVESVVDMSMEGKTDCEVSWDLNGLSPILQVTSVGLSPADASHENKRQTSLLIPPLRQGRLNLHVSAVGGIRLSKAETSREDREGLYDWKFFNALVSPDEDSPDRILKVIHDKRTMGKLLSVVELVSAELHKVLSYVLTQGNFFVSSSHCISSSTNAITSLSNSLESQRDIRSRGSFRSRPRDSGAQNGSFSVPLPLRQRQSGEYYPSNHPRDYFWK